MSRKSNMSITLTKKETEELERCKQTLTITWQSSTSPKIDEIFYNWCYQTNEPYVRIRKFRKSANFMMELPNDSRSLDAEGINQFRELCLSRGCSEKGNEFKNPSINDVPLELADEFAKRLVEIGMDFCRRNPRK